MTASLVWALRRGRSQTLALAAGIDDQMMCRQHQTGERHPAWLLGHLILADVYLLHLLGVEPLPGDFPALLQAHGPKSTPITDPAAYSCREALVVRLEQTGLRRTSAIDSMPVGGLSAAMPDTFLARSQPTLEHHIQGLIFHEGYHAGQLSSWRRAHGLSPVSWRLAEPGAEPVG